MDDELRYRLELLNEQHSIEGFACEGDEFGDYLREDALQDIEHGFALTFVEIGGDDRMKVGYIIGGVLLGLFAIAQLLQLCGLIGIGFSIAGIGFTILGGLGSFLCFQKAFTPPPPQ